MYILLLLLILIIIIVFISNPCPDITAPVDLGVKHQLTYLHF